MKRRLQAALVVVIVAFGVVTSPALAAGEPTSVEAIDVGVGYVTLQFTNPNDFRACFEYRSDGDTSQATGEANPNTAYTDLYPSFCLIDEATTQTFHAASYVEVRSVFGAERDIDFDWTAFEVLPEPPDGSEDITLGGAINDNESDQDNDQGQNQKEEQAQVSNQHSSHTIVQENISTSHAGAEAINTCEASQSNGAGSDGSADCVSDDSVKGESTEGNVNQSSEAHQTSTIDNRQIQSQAGGSQTNEPTNDTEQNISGSVGSIGSNVVNHSESNIQENSDNDVNDVNDVDGAIIDNSTGGGNESVIVDLLGELRDVVVDVIETRVPLVIDND